MRIIEIITGVQVPITNEENDILNKFDFAEEVKKTELTEREALLANSLVVKNILTRHNSDGKITYTKKIRS